MNRGLLVDSLVVHEIQDPIHPDIAAGATSNSSGFEQASRGKDLASHFSVKMAGDAEYPLKPILEES